MLGRGGAAPWHVVYSSPPLIPLYIGEGARGAGPLGKTLGGGGGQGVGGLPPKQRGAPPLGFPPTPRRMGPRRGARQAH